MDTAQTCTHAHDTLWSVKCVTAYREQPVPDSRWLPLLVLCTETLKSLYLCVLPLGVRRKKKFVVLWSVISLPAQGERKVEVKDEEKGDRETPGIRRPSPRPRGSAGPERLGEGEHEGVSVHNGLSASFPQERRGGGRTRAVGKEREMEDESRSRKEMEIATRMSRAKVKRGARAT